MNRDINSIINKYITNYKYDNIIKEINYRTNSIKRDDDLYDIFNMYKNEVDIKYNKILKKWYIGFIYDFDN